MKTINLLLALTLIFVSCKKSNTTTSSGGTTAPSSNGTQDSVLVILNCWYANPDSVHYFMNLPCYPTSQNGNSVNTSIDSYTKAGHLEWRTTVKRQDANHQCIYNFSALVRPAVIVDSAEWKIYINGALKTQVNKRGNAQCSFQY